MTSLTIRNQIAAILATVIVSTACLVGAVGPATSHGTASAVVAERTLA